MNRATFTFPGMRPIPADQLRPGCVGFDDTASGIRFVRDADGDWQHTFIPGTEAAERFAASVADVLLDHREKTAA